MIEEEEVLEKGMPEDRDFDEGNHLFERIHGKDPLLMQDVLEKMKVGTTQYSIKEIE
jgi:hypothetical protein